MQNSNFGAPTLFSMNQYYLLFFGKSFPSLRHVFILFSQWCNSFLKGVGYFQESRHAPVNRFEFDANWSKHENCVLPNNENTFPWEPNQFNSIFQFNPQCKLKLKYFVKTACTEAFAKLLHPQEVLAQTHVEFNFKISVIWAVHLCECAPTISNSPFWKVSFHRIISPISVADWRLKELVWLTSEHSE